jgi:allantoicase
MPGFGRDMSDGWETRRRRGPGHDWVVVRLAAAGIIDRVEIDTAFFKGNYPDSFSLDGCWAPGWAHGEPAPAGRDWIEIAPPTKLQAHTRHLFQDVPELGPFTHVRLNIYPDGGVSRLRLWGNVDADARAEGNLQRLNALLHHQAEAELRTCCGSSTWAAKMAAARPFANLASMLQTSDAICARLTDGDY